MLVIATIPRARSRCSSSRRFLSSTPAVIPAKRATASASWDPGASDGAVAPGDFWDPRVKPAGDNQRGGAEGWVGGESLGAGDQGRGSRSDRKGGAAAAGRDRKSTRLNSSP